MSSDLIFQQAVKAECQFRGDDGFCGHHKPALGLDDPRIVQDPRDRGKGGRSSGLCVDRAARLRTGRT
jgi:hypothetical protein